LEFLLPDGPRLGSKVLALENVSKRLGSRLVLPRFSIEIGARERIGIVGRNGAGKTTLLKLLSGELQPDEGSYSCGETVRMARIDQERLALEPERTVQQEIAGANDWVQFGGHSMRIEAFLDQFLFVGAKKDARIGTLSGGERARLCVAKLMVADANVLILDEPTNDLDLPTLRALEEALIAFPGSAIVVSHDRWFLDRIATRVLAFDDQGQLLTHTGDVAALIARLAQQSEEREARADRAAATARKPLLDAAAKVAASAPKSRKLAPWEQRELEQLTAQIELEEAELARLDARISQPELYSAPRAEQELTHAARAACAERIAKLYARWEELEA
jgi:ATP-binding cassette subfamily F protein uup